MMKLCGITKDTTVDPNVGVIERYADGTPNGCFREGALALITAHVPDIEAEDYARYIPEYQELKLKLGYTAYTEVLISSPEANVRAFNAYNMLDKNNLLMMHVNIAACVFAGDYDSIDEQMDTILKLREECANNRLHLTDVKFIMDGVVEGETAYVSKPYYNEESYSGISV